jgi:hypothetical protein
VVASTGRRRWALVPDVPAALWRFVTPGGRELRDFVAAAGLRGSCTTTASGADFGPFDFRPVVVDLVALPGFRLRPETRRLRKLTGSVRLLGLF